MAAVEGVNSEVPWCEYVVAEGVSGRGGALVIPLGHPGRGGPQGRRYDRIQGLPPHLAERAPKGCPFRG